MPKSKDLRHLPKCGFNTVQRDAKGYYCPVCGWRAQDTAEFEAWLDPGDLRQLHKQTLGWDH